jgi:hypothetical protein
MVSNTRQDQDPIIEIVEATGLQMRKTHPESSLRSAEPSFCLARTRATGPPSGSIAVFQATGE